MYFGRIRSLEPKVRQVQREQDSSAARGGVSRRKRLYTAISLFLLFPPCNSVKLRGFMHSSYPLRVRFPHDTSIYSRVWFNTPRLAAAQIRQYLQRFGIKPDFRIIIAYRSTLPDVLRIPLGRIQNLSADAAGHRRTDAHPHTALCGNRTDTLSVYPVYTEFSCQGIFRDRKGQPVDPTA
jgi:hypothetical protein